MECIVNLVRIDRPYNHNMLDLIMFFRLLSFPFKRQHFTSLLYLYYSKSSTFLPCLCWFYYRLKSLFNYQPTSSYILFTSRMFLPFFLKEDIYLDDSLRPFLPFCYVFHSTATSDSCLLRRVASLLFELLMRGEAHYNISDSMVLQETMSFSLNQLVQGINQEKQYLQEYEQVLSMSVGESSAMILLERVLKISSLSLSSNYSSNLLIYSSQNYSSSSLFFRVAMSCRKLDRLQVLLSISSIKCSICWVADGAFGWKYQQEIEDSISLSMDSWFSPTMNYQPICRHSLYSFYRSGPSPVHTLTIQYTLNNYKHHSKASFLESTLLPWILQSQFSSFYSQMDVFFSQDYCSC